MVNTQFNVLPFFFSLVNISDKSIAIPQSLLEAWGKISTIAECLKARHVVFQCPASFRPERKNLDNLKSFFRAVGRKDFRFVWEPRGSWPEAVIEELCGELDLIYCVDPFKNESLSGDTGYFRLHGITGYRYEYSDSDLSRLKDICSKKRIAYVMLII